MLTIFNPLLGQVMYTQPMGSYGGAMMGNGMAGSFAPAYGIATGGGGGYATSAYSGVDNNKEADFEGYIPILLCWILASQSSLTRCFALFRFTTLKHDCTQRCMRAET